MKSPKPTVASADRQTLATQRLATLKLLVEERLRSATPAEVLHESLARQVELEMENEQLLQSRPAELQAQLAASEERYRRLFNASPDAIFLTTAEGKDTGRILDANDAAASSHGYTREELLTMRIADLDTPESAEKVEARLRQLVTDRSIRFEVEHRRKDGSVFPVEVSARLTEVDGVQCAVAYNRDISQRSQADEERQLASKRLRLALAASRFGIWRYNLQTGISEWDERMLEIYGLITTPSLAAFHEMIEPEDLPWMQKTWAALADKTQSTFSGEFRIRWPDGQLRHIRSMGGVENDRHGRPGWVTGINEDVTEYERLKEAGREHRVRLELAAKAGGVGFWDWDLTTNKVFFSAEWKRQIGYEDHEISPRYEEWESRLHPEDRESAVQHVKGYIAGSIPEHATEFRLRYKDGSYRWIFAQGEVLRSADGVPSRMLGCHLDVTPRKLAELALRSSQERLDRMLEVLTEGVVVHEHHGAILYSNRAATKILGLSHEEMAGRTSANPRWRAVHEDNSPFPGEDHPAAVTLRTGQPQHDVIMGVHKPDGEVSWISINSIPLQLSPSSPPGVVCSFSDITDWKRAEAGLRESNQRFQSLIDAAAEIVWTGEVDGSAADDSPSWRAFTGQTFEQWRGFGWLNAIHPDDREATAREWRKAVETATPIEIEYRLQHVSGGWRWTLVRAVPLLRPDGTVRLWVGMNKDITERKRAEGALQLARFTIERASLGIFWVRPDATIADVNEAACRSMGYSRAELLKLRVEDIDLHYSMERWPAHWEELRQKKTMTFESRKRCKDGSEFDVEISANWMEFGGEELNCAFVQDITERKRAEAAVKRGTERIQAIIETEPECIKVVSLDGRLLEMNPAGLQMIEATDLASVENAPVVDLIHPEDRPAFTELHERASIGGTGMLEFRVVGLKGTTRWMETHSVPLRESDGSIASVLSITRDVTARKAAEVERRALESQLQQAQKMEAIGTLAGGIAHDFNNILGAITGNLELAILDSREGKPVDESLAEIMKASDRAKSLVRQILTFSRQQPLDRKVVSLDTIVAEAARFMRSTISAMVAIKVSIEPGVAPVLADANQVHQIIVNLCTNAWHAMEERAGTIEIKLESVSLDTETAGRIEGLSAGDYACLTVIDTGKGMDNATLKRIFDPFFTTKEVGKGTGLGLSVVHGIVRNHAGAIRVSSRPGEGTSFQIYFPAARQSDEPAISRDALVPGRGQHILYLDDEEPLTRVMTRTLQKLGYQVTSFSDPELALAEVRKNTAQFDLFITDYEMTGLTGLDFSAELLKIRPDSLILLCSGYLKREDREQAEALGIRRILSKPCETATLSQILDELLSAGRQP